ncbi:MAG: exodeoxyribonuclease VII large subunit, partial [Sphingomicrobium sp.]
RLPDPSALLAPARQRFDELGDRLPRALAARAVHARADLAGVAPRLRRELLDHKIERSIERLVALWQMAQLVHPDRPLSRGFARVTARDGRTLVTAAAARAAAALDLHFADGAVPVSVDRGPATAPHLERKRPRAYVPGQAGLFDRED